jgi:hypothetical protein
MAGFRFVAAAGKWVGYIPLLVCLSSVPCAAAPTDEYQLKAALIYKLTKFIEWPEAAEGRALESFGICLLGDDLFGDSLDALAKRKAKDMPIMIYRHAHSEAIDQRCQILFISDSKQAFLGSILQSLQGRPILTLGDMQGFAERGGILQFTRGKKRIGFLINLESAKQSQLTIAAPLLDLATVIKPR